MAHYFSHFPHMLYDAVQDATSSPKLVTNFLRRVKVREGIKNQASLFSTYRIPSGDTPEMVSFRFYDTVDYYWVVLLMNNIKDRFYDWPKTEHQFLTYVNDKYADPNAVHSYEVTQSSGPTTSLDDSHLIEVNSDAVGASSLTNLEYERRLEDDKSLIKILDRRYLSQFVEEFSKLVKG